MSNLFQRLNDYRNSDYYGFHMPGHKRNLERFGGGLPFGIDITEIEGFDDLHHAEDVLKDAQERAARLYRAEETHFLVNGSTVGILSAILGTTNRGDKILIARNCHKSVYHAIFLNELEPVYVYPKYVKELQINGEVTVSDIGRALHENPDVRAVVIVSPTYDGVLSDVRKIAELVHSYQIPLIVDEAHGAHFGFHPYFPENANVKGADLVIHSVHKTLPSLTQTALLHMNGNFVERENVRSYLHMLQSSSPSYVLMAGIDFCMDLLEQEGPELFETYTQNIEAMRNVLKQLKHLQIVETGEFDRSKFVISVKDTSISGKELGKLLLEKYHLQMEMTAGSYVLAMTTVGDTKEGLERLKAALLETDSGLKNIESREEEFQLPVLPIVCKSAKVLKCKRKHTVSYVAWEEAEGETAAEYAYIYPPGIPFVVPGERITKEAADCLKKYGKLGFTIEGIAVENHIGVWKNG